MSTSKTRIRGITIELDGDASGLSKAIKDVNSEIKGTQNALKDVDRLLKLDPGNAELLTQKQKLLNQALEETKLKLEKEREVLEDVAKRNTTGQLQEQQDALQREIIETESKVKDLEKQMESFGSVGGQQLKALGERMKEFGSKLSQIGQQLSMKVTVPIVAAFTAGVSAASDYEENINKLSVAFGDCAGQVRDFTDNAIEAFGMSKVEASSAASAFGALAKGIGLGEQAAAEMSIELTGLTSDLSSYFNASTDESAKALEAVFTGEAESLKKFGVIMSQTNLEAFAKAHNKVYSSASEAEKVMIRYNYVLEKTKDAQGDYARSSDGFANTFRSFKAALEDLAVAIGTEVLPVITPLIKGFAEFVKKLGDMPDGLRKVVVYIGMLAAAIGPVLSVLGSLIFDFGALIPLLGAAGATKGVVGAAGAAGQAFTGLGIAASAGTAVAVAGVGLLLGVLAAKVWVEHGDQIKAIFRSIGDTLKNSFSTAADWVVKKWDDTKTYWINGAKTVKTNLATAVTETGKIYANFFTSTYRDLKNWTVNLGTTIVNGVKDIGKSFADGFWSMTASGMNRLNEFKQSAALAFDTLRNTVGSAATSFRTSLSNAFETARSAASTAFDTIESTAYTVRNNIKASWDALKTSAQSTFNGSYTSIKSYISDAFAAISKAGSSASDAIEDSWNSLKTKTATLWSGTYGSIGSIIAETFAEISSTAASVADSISSAWDTIKEKAKSVFSSAYDSVKTTVVNAFTAIKDAITGTTTSGTNSMTALSQSVTDEMTASQKTVKDTWSALKTQMSQKLSWNLQGISAQKPHITTSGKFVLNSDGSIRTSPTIDISWYRKAMQFGTILSGATIFGAQNGKLLGGGEAGKEVIVGSNSLHTMVHNAAQAGNAQITQQLAIVTSLLMEYLPECAEQKTVTFDGSAMAGQIMPAINRSLGMALT